MIHRNRPLLALLVLASVLPSTIHADDAAAPTVMVVIGVGGDPEYKEQFFAWADKWQHAATQAKANYQEIGRSNKQETSDRELLRKTLETEAKSTTPLWLVMIGHGTYFRDLAKFNLRGADVAASELAKWIEPLKRPVVIINCASSSGPFINRLSGSNRIVITSTKSGMEQNFARFGAYLSQAITDSRADLDHDDEVSLLEAFLSASGRVALFYEEEGRLPTEQALIDDNGDQAGTPADFFRGVRAQATAKDGKSVDGLAAGRIHLMQDPARPPWSADQLAERSRLEQAIEKLRVQKSQREANDYYLELEALLVKLAQLYAQVEAHR